MKFVRIKKKIVFLWSLPYLWAEPNNKSQAVLGLLLITGTLPTAFELQISEVIQTAQHHYPNRSPTDSINSPVTMNVGTKRNICDESLITESDMSGEDSFIKFSNIETRISKKSKESFAKTTDSDHTDGELSDDIYIISDAESVDDNMEDGEPPIDDNSLDLENWDSQNKKETSDISNDLPRPDELLYNEIIAFVRAEANRIFRLRKSKRPRSLYSPYVLFFTVVICLIGSCALLIRFFYKDHVIISNEMPEVIKHRFYEMDIKLKALQDQVDFMQKNLAVSLEYQQAIMNICNRLCGYDSAQENYRRPEASGTRKTSQDYKKQKYNTGEKSAVNGNCQAHSDKCQEQHRRPEDMNGKYDETYKRQNHKHQGDKNQDFDPEKKFCHSQNGRTCTEKESKNYHRPEHSGNGGHQHANKHQAQADYQYKKSESFEKRGDDGSQKEQHYRTKDGRYQNYENAEINKYKPDHAYKDSHKYNKETFPGDNNRLDKGDKGDKNWYIERAGARESARHFNKNPKAKSNRILTED